MRGAFGAVGLVAVLVGGAAGQEAVTFKQYPYKVGDKTRTTKTEDTTGGTTINAMGKEQKTKEKKKKTLVYVTEVLEVGADAGKPAKLKRTYEKAVEERNGVETTLSLDGKTVTIERKEEKYTFTADGAALDAAATAELDREFTKKGNLGDNLFPEKGVKPGDSWDLTEKFLKEMDTPDNPFVIAPKGAAVTGKLLSTTKKGPTTFGDLEVTADLPLTDLRGKLPLKLNPGSGWKIAMKGTGCLDGTSPEGNSTATMTIALEGATMGVGVKIDTQVKMSSRTNRVSGGKQ
ncbi:hypothetical protein [Urbifossiella limnaea]|uniref:Uncharacterized protein n=1 Tax=Urbifossiella limnaea TaxID=2528023 RepID=A0A517Y0T7_9BACT|nr:hypothetical protein [Urbifossiella limnaea]QDU23367.1 hypothetical protein ETAA1_53660 [Urbifossiella limnaea]